MTISISPEEAGERLDKILASRGLGWSRAVVQRWIEEGRVTVDGAEALSKTRPRAGALVEVRPAPPPPSEAVPQDIPLVVLHEDEHLLVIDKPAGLVVHPAPGHADGTLVNALLFHAQIEEEPPEDEGAGTGTGTIRPGIVHRLDKDTSGVMVVAKTIAAREGLIAQFSAHTIERAYLAIAVGEPPASVRWDTLHGRHRTDRKKFTTKVTEGKRAITAMRVLERFAGAALVECRLETGRTHQIRVHLAEAGFPILGDPLYAKPPKDPQLRAIAETIGRQALHATLLGLTHPITKAPVRFQTDPPPDFAAALAALRGTVSRSAP